MKARRMKIWLAVDDPEKIYWSVRQATLFAPGSFMCRGSIALCTPTNIVIVCLFGTAA